MTAIREIARVTPQGTLEIRNPALPKGGEVEVIVLLPSKGAPASSADYDFLRVLEESGIEGPPDWSANVQGHLHAGKLP